MITKRKTLHKLGGLILDRITPASAMAIANSLILGIDPFIEDVRLRGGKGFLERAKLYGRTDQGYELYLPDWYQETLELVGDWRIPYVAVTGCAQSGKSLSAQLAFTDLAVHGRMPIGYVYADGKSLDKYVGQQFRPIADYWTDAVETAHSIQIRKPNDKKTNDPYEIGKVSFNFTLASTSKTTTQTEGKSVISTSGASYTAAALGGDERSRWPHGADFSARVGASPIGSHPIRDIGTYGGGNGISVFVNQCQHIFTQHINCNSCGECIVLSPKGCLLTKTTIVDAYGRQIESYFTDEGRPADNGWWCADESDPVKTAMVCCSECGSEIPYSQRVTEPHMRCRLTGRSLRDYLDSVPQDYKSADRVAIELSPLARRNSENIAFQQIRKGLSCEDPRVWQQEDLGIVSTGKVNRLTMDILRPLIGADYPDQLKPWRTVAGIDQGRGEHWIWIMEVYQRTAWHDLTWPEFSRSAIRRVITGTQIHRALIPELLQTHNVDIAITDAEPDVTWASALADEFPGTVFLGDQVGTNKATRAALNDLVMGEIRSGGDRFDCYKISNPVFKRAVINNAIGKAYDLAPAYRFPETWRRYDGMDVGSSPLRHLMAVSFDPVEEKWLRPDDKKDDLFMAALFAEAALAVCYEGGGLSSFEIEK